MAGLSAARALVARGRAVVVYDKGRGPGGRMSSRRAESGAGRDDAPRQAGRGGLVFDHGAQFFTARDRRFVSQVDRWQRQGVVMPWNGRFVTLAAGQTVATAEERPPEESWWVGAPTMSAVTKDLAAGLDLRCGAPVTSLRRARSDGAWLVGREGETPEAFDRLIVTLPPVQAAALLGHPDSQIAQGEAGLALLDRLRRVEMAPCWAVMAAFDARLACAADAVKVTDPLAPIAWAARDSSKPQRPAGERWVIHASPAWSVEHLESSADAVAALLLRALGAMLAEPALAASEVVPAYCSAHRWRYAKTMRPLAPAPVQAATSVPQTARPEADGAAAASQPEAEVRLLADLNLVLAGDWTIGARVESAWLSGQTAADLIAGAA